MGEERIPLKLPKVRNLTLYRTDEDNREPSQKRPKVKHTEGYERATLLEIVARNRVLESSSEYN